MILLPSTQEAQAATSEPEVRVTLGEIQRQRQALSRRAEIARVFDFALRGFSLESVYQRLAA